MAETTEVLLVGWCTADGALDDPTAAALERLVDLTGAPSSVTALLLVGDIESGEQPSEVAVPAGVAEAGLVDVVVAPDGPTGEVVASRSAALARTIGADLIVVPQGLEAEDLVARVAGELDAAAVPRCRTLARSGSHWVAAVALYGGAVEALVEVPDGLIVAGLEMDPATTGPLVPWPARPDSSVLAESHTARLELLEVHEEPDTGAVPLERAQRIVAGGRGVGGPEGFAVLAGLARQLDAEMASSRPPCDSGWVPRTSQVGITGRQVRPDLYLAVGISGSVQHLAGMVGSGCIVAVNQDPAAPIFSHAHIGVVGDWSEVVAGLCEGLNGSAGSAP